MLSQEDSHYCRARTAREYLGDQLSINQMYRDFCQPVGRGVASKYIYATTHCREFNFGFHEPAEDLCNICALFNVKQEKTQAAVEQHEVHVTSYKDVHDLKNNCVAAAQEGKRGYAAASFDQQQVRTNIETLSQ